MQRRYFWAFLAVLVVLFSGIMIIFPGSHATAAQAHAMMHLDTPTPTPDVSETLQTAQQADSNAQTILSIINILDVVYPLFLALAVTVLGVIGFRGYRSFQKEARAGVEDINQLKKEAEEKKVIIEHLQTALVYMALGDRLANQKDTRQAIEAYKKAGSKLPEDPQINYALGRIYSGIGYYEEAVVAFHRAIDAQPQYAEAEKELGLAYRMRGDYQKDLNAQELRKNDYENAKEHLLKAIELQPGYVDALSSLGGIYRREGDYENALEYYERAYRADTNSSYALGNVASLSLYLGKKDEANYYYMLTEAAATVRTKEPYSEIYWDYYDLALAQLVLGKADEAKKNYQKAIGYTPGTAQFDSVLNVLYFLQKAKDPIFISGLDDVVEMIEKERSTKIALG
jgi:tetratricopeptide (TPR) repeat protein